MHVLVIREFVRNTHTDKDLRIIMVARGDDLFGGAIVPNMISPVVTLEGAAAYGNSNPYFVYGDACAKFTGKDKNDLHITVAECTSDNLDGW